MAIGVLGCLFGILGIFTIGIVFVPLAFLCGLVGFISGTTQGSISIIFVAGICFFLGVMGFVHSPSLWLLTGVVAAGVTH